MVLPGGLCPGVSVGGSLSGDLCLGVAAQVTETPPHNLIVATGAGGTHPTRMHSCFKINFKLVLVPTSFKLLDDITFHFQ